MRAAGVLVVALAGVHGMPAFAGEPGAWERVSDKKGVVVDRRAVDGSKLKEFRGRAVIDVPLATLLAVFNDVDRATEWMDSCNGSSMVEDRGDFLKIVYNRTHAGWPVADRDAVLRNTVTWEPDEGRVRLDFVAVEHAGVPPQKGVVRMPFVRGHWYFWPEAEGRRTRVEYQVHASPGGLLPEWLVNYVSRELPRKTILGLMGQVKRRSYPELEQRIRAFPEYRALTGRFPALASREAP